MIDIPLIQWPGFSGNIHREPKKSLKPIKSTEVWDVCVVSIESTASATKTRQHSNMPTKLFVQT